MKNETLQDQLTDLDPPYESMEELRIGRVLDQYGLPFFYRQPTIIYNEGANEIWKPSFTLPQYGCQIVDYVPGEDRQPVQDRIRIYRYNKIPAVVLGPKDLDKPNWDRSLYERIQKELQKQHPLLYGSL